MQMEKEQVVNGKDNTAFFPLQGVNTTTATAYDDILANVKKNVKRNLPRLHQLPEFHKVKGHNKPIALVGGGPSLKYYLDDIRQYRTIFACGSSHDYLRENNINLAYAGICDPDPLSIKYFQKLDAETKYLIASNCDDKIFEHLKNHQVVMWHCHSDQFKTEEIEPGYQAVGGGCTIGLRAICIAMILGYTNIHLFGYDSCLGEDESSHAYLAEDVGEIYEIKVGTKDKLSENAKIFKCAGYQLAQADQFIDFYKKQREFFTPTIYGDGLIAEIMKHENQRISNGVKND